MTLLKKCTMHSDELLHFYQYRDTPYCYKRTMYQEIEEKDCTFISELYCRRSDDTCWVVHYKHYLGEEFPVKEGLPLKVDGKYAIKRYY